MPQLLATLLIIQLLPTTALSHNESTDSICFRDTIDQFVFDSIMHDFDTINPKETRLVKYFKYIGTDSVFIERTFTSDPHFICSYPKGILSPHQIYSYTICFYHLGRYGRMQKQMGFRMSNGSYLRIILTGNYPPPPNER